jgi:hypothetical protein
VGTPMRRSQRLRRPRHCDKGETDRREQRPFATAPASATKVLTRRQFRQQVYGTPDPKSRRREKTETRRGKLWTLAPSPGILRNGPGILMYSTGGANPV